MDYIRLTIVLVILSLLLPAAADPADNASHAELHVAVASNFAQCFSILSEGFTHLTGITIISSPGSTGRHFAQIKAGAPFDIFLAADAHRPTLLEECGLAEPGSRFTYAVGRLVFWCPSLNPGEFENVTAEVLTTLLTQPGIKHLAITNKRLAPYGQAAHEVLNFLGLEADLKRVLVTGQNISQTWQFVASGNAQAGFVALSQVLGSESKHWHLIPDSMHDPIIQQGVLLVGKDDGAKRESAERFLQYLQSEAAQNIIGSFGYGLGLGMQQ